MTRRPPRLGRAAATVIAATVLSFLGASPASAHSELERSDPPNGGMVAEGRTTLTLWFSEPIRTAASTFDLYNLDGGRVSVTVSTPGAGDEGFIEIGTDPLAGATYQLDWTVLSADDGHPSRGSLLFGVGMRPAAAMSSGGAGFPPASGFLLRLIDLSTIMLVIGAMAISGRVLGSIGPAGNAPRAPALYIGAVAACLAVVAGAITPFVLEPHAGASFGAWFDATRATLTGTSWGRLWLVREVALVTVAAALWSKATRRDAGRNRSPVAIVAMVAAVWFGSWAGHAAGLTRMPGVAALASASHLVAASVWAGGLTVLAACLIPVMRRNPDARGPIIASAWRAFSPMAAVATVVLVATGLYESGRHLPDLASLASTLYGGVVAGKVVLIAVALTLAGFNTLLVNPRLAAPVGRILGRPMGWSPVSLHRFSTVVAAEVVVLIVTVAGAALLTSVPTAREIELAGRETAPRSANVDGLFLTFEEVPTGANFSRLIVRARSTVKPDPGPISGVEVLLVGPPGGNTYVSLDPVEPGRYEGETDRLASGAWQAAVVVRRSGLPDALAPLAWNVAAADSEGARPLEVVTSGLAVLLLVALGAALILARRRREDAGDMVPLVDETVGAPR